VSLRNLELDRSLDPTTEVALFEGYTFRATTAYRHIMHRSIGLTTGAEPSASCHHLARDGYDSITVVKQPKATNSAVDLSVAISTSLTIICIR